MLAGQSESAKEEVSDGAVQESCGPDESKRESGHRGAQRTRSEQQSAIEDAGAASGCVRWGGRFHRPCERDVESEEEAERVASAISIEDCISAFEVGHRAHR